MAIKKRTDQLPAILSGDVDNNDLMYLVHENAQAETGYDSKKIFVSDVGRKLNNGVEYATELPSFPPGDQNPLDALEYLNSKINDLYPVNSASGPIVNFTTSLALPLVALKTNIVAQGGGGTPSSPVAITGVSSITLTCADGEMQTVDTFTLPLGQTVYGGYVDWKNGKMVVTWVRYTNLAMNISSIAKDSSSWRVYYSSEFYGLDNQNKEGLCDKLTFRTSYSGVNNNNYSISFPSSSGNQVLLRNDDLSTSSDVETFLAALDCVYPLATPIEIDLSTTMPSTIEGSQNWFADSGDIELEYKMGVQEYIDKKIAEVQALIL